MYTTMKKAHTHAFTKWLNMVDANMKCMIKGEVETVVTEDVVRRLFGTG